MSCFAVENKYAIELSKYESLKKRFTTLSDRLDVTSDELEAERKKRYEIVKCIDYNTRNE